ncbi:MAG TPA: glycosyltransferase [Candidatus Latescibacteria bacterium]|nr:glycosyltransferase [Candidatus Latescibacterota bacterium]
MKKVLVIAYYFPPMGMGGVQRVLKFVKYLPDFGWKPTVLTVKLASYFAFDHSLMEDIPAEAEVFRTESLDPLRILGVLGLKGKALDPPESLRSSLSLLSRTIFVPDNKIGWLPFALARAREILSGDDFDLVFATAPPFTCHLVGLLVSQLWQRPLVVDFRDAWVQFQFARYPTPVHLWLNQVMEERAVRTADRVIATNEYMCRNLRGRYRGVDPAKFTVITHGFDPDDFKESSKLPSGLGLTRQAERPSVPAEFVITYTGSFWENLTPKYLLRALRSLLDEKRELVGRIKAVFVGLFRDDNRKLVKDLRLEDVVEVTGYVSHSQSIGYLLRSDLLWMMTGRGKGAEAVTQGKIFEYIGSGRPILACVPEGAAAEIVRSLGNSTVVAPDDVEGIKKALLRYYEAYEQGKIVRTDPRIIERYDRRRLTGRLAGIFDEILACRS